MAPAPENPHGRRPLRGQRRHRSPPAPCPHSARTKWRLRKLALRPHSHLRRWRPVGPGHGGGKHPLGLSGYPRPARRPRRANGPRPAAVARRGRTRTGNRRLAAKRQRCGQLNRPGTACHRLSGPGLAPGWGGARALPRSGRGSAATGRGPRVRGGHGQPGQIAPQRPFRRRKPQRRRSAPEAGGPAKQS